MSPQLIRFLKYLGFKGKCAAYQEQNPLTLDYPRVLKNIEELEEQQKEKTEALAKVMPKVKKTKWQKKPKSTHKKDGTLSVAGQNWYNALKENGIPITSKEAKCLEKVRVFSYWEEPNPGSSDQVKQWLFDLGWEPCFYKYVREDDGSERKIPQVRKEGELTPSVLNLMEDNPDLKYLEGLTVVQHRLAIFKGFRDECIPQEDGTYTIAATIGGLTNTLRFKHKKPLVNLPGVDKPYGKEIRGCLMAPEGYEVVGADVVSLEATTKRHYIHPYDPEYADEMGQDTFDEHIDLAVKNGEMSQEDYEWYVRQNEDTTNEPERFKKLKKIRKGWKPVNYAAVYGIGPPKLSRELGTTKKRASELLDSYWERNWAVLECVKPLKVKRFGNHNWLYNPVSGFWYELRYDKDKFSTLNQGTGVYLFDSWLARCAAEGYMGNAQFHDETLGFTAYKQKTSAKLIKSVNRLNEELNLNVIMSIDIQYGENYADVH